MQEYDVALKTLLRGSTGRLFEDLTGAVAAKWLDIELPKVQSRRADLLAETADGTILHLELQSGNDSEMALRMAEYCLGVYRQFKLFPRQSVLYVGESALRMESVLKGPRCSFSYDLVDIRDLEGERLLGSPDVGDNVVAILARLSDRRAAVQRILKTIASLEMAERETALRQLLILSGLRRLEDTVEREIRNVPILNDIMDHKVLGREYKRGRQEGRQEGEITILRRQIMARFGTLPEWAEERLNSLPEAELEALCTRVLDANSVETLFGQVSGSSSI